LINSEILFIIFTLRICLPVILDDSAEGKAVERLTSTMV
jgi:hypothetical protein